MENGGRNGGVWWCIMATQKKVWGGGSAWFDGDVKREKRGAKQRRYVLQRNLYVDKY
jgi:hypothetical protein